MHTGKYYSFREVVTWTRRDIFSHILIASVITCCYNLLGWKWLAIPWLPIALLGTAVAFVVGFKNNASYDRTWEARRVWGSILNASRSLGIMVKDFVTNRHAATPTTDVKIKEIQRVLIYRHFAWLTALRFQLREPRVWESIYIKHNAEYKKKYFQVDEHSNQLEESILPYLSEEELRIVKQKTNKAAQIIVLQSAHLKQLEEDGLIENFRHIELERMMIEFYSQQGASERIKNFPYPRQYATLNKWFIKIFIILVPLGMLQEFEKLGGNLIWLAIPFSAMASWVFTTLEKIGESSESPFEGSANDVPITAISRSIEIDLREMLGETDLPPVMKAQNNILT